MRYIRFLGILGMVLCIIGIFANIAMPMGTKHQPLDYNLLLITIDTLRADHLGCYGYKQVETPNIDRLASEGVLFTQAISPVPITLPSHASIMTGLYPVQHGVRNNGNFSLPQEAITLAEVMKEHGYQTGACVGSFVLDSVFGLDQGFDYYNDNITQGKKRLHSLYNERNASAVNKVAIQWLEGHKDNKFFLWLHYYDPHSPYSPPFPYNINYRNHLYDGEIAFVDTCLGELFKQMKQMGLMDKTLILFTADHGEGLGKHNELTHAVFIYDATVWVPLIISAPGVLEKGKTISAMVSTMDILPTLTDLFGLKQVSDITGKSLMPLIQGKAHATHLQLMCESLCPELNFGWSRVEGIRTPQWKYIQAPVSELYHLSEDHAEEKNVLQQGSDIHENWKASLENLKQMHPPIIQVSHSAQMDPETEHRLRSLGYIWTQAKTDTEKDSIKPDPKDKIHIMNNFDDGMGFLITGLYDQAIEEFKKILKDDPDNMAAYFNMACAYEEKGQLDQAESFFNKVLELNPEHSDVYNHLGLIQYNRGKWDMALKAFQRSVDIFEYAEVYYNLSLVYQKMDKTDEAIGAIKKTLELDPDYAEAWNQFGNLLMAKNDLQGAAKQFEKAIELDPKHTTAHNNLGLVYSKMGQMDEAIKKFEEAVAVDPDSAEAHNNLGSLYLGQGKYDQARDELKKALEIRPNYVKALLNSGMVNVSLNDYQVAEQLFRKALEADSECTEAYSQLGYLYILKQDFDKALASFQKMLSIQPEDPKAYYYMGKAYYALGQSQSAIKAWQKALNLQPGLAGVQLDLGNAYFDMGDFQKAQKEWGKALADKPIDIPTHLLNLGMFYFQSKQYEKAVQAWRKAGELKSFDSNLHFNIALAYFQQGDYKKADLELKESLRLQPDFQRAKMLQDRIKGLGQN